MSAARLILKQPTEHRERAAESAMESLATSNAHGSVSQSCSGIWS